MLLVLLLLLLLVVVVVVAAAAVVVVVVVVVALLLLFYTTNARLAYRAMQPSTEDRDDGPWPPWGRHAAGQPDTRPADMGRPLGSVVHSSSVSIFHERECKRSPLDGPEPQSEPRRDGHDQGEHEQQQQRLNNYEFVPARLLHGLLPAALLDEYHFWQDTDDLQGRGSLEGVSKNGDPGSQC